MKDTIKIFIGNLDERATEDEIHNLFLKYGPVVECAVMKQYAFVHMRGAHGVKKAIDELNGSRLHGKRMLVELSKPRPKNTWKIFVANLSVACDSSDIRALFQAYGRVLECDVVKGNTDNAVLTANYAFVHMEKESDARAAIENLNGKQLKGNRISVQMSNKSSKPMSSNGSSGPNRSHRPHDREPPQNRTDRKRASETTHSSIALKSPYDHYSGDNARYDFESRMRPSSPLDYSRDRSPLRWSPTRPSYVFAQSAASLASRLHASGSGYRSLSSAYGDQPTSSLSAAYNRQSSSSSTAYGTHDSTLSSTYSNQGAYDSQSSAYEKETQSSYGSQRSAYSIQGSAMSANYGSRLPSVVASYSSQTSTSSYPSHSTSSHYASSAALAGGYRPQQRSVHENSQMAGLGMQSPYSSLSSSVDTPMYERTRLSPPLNSASDSYKRLASDRRYPELADYRHLTQETVDPFRRPPSKSQLDLESHSDYPSYSYSDFMSGSPLSAYQHRL